MEWQLLVVPGLAVPIVLFPVAFVFYLNTGKVLSLVASFRERLRARTVVAETALEASASIMCIPNTRKERCKT